MTTNTSATVTITDEAAARIAELGQQRQFEQMLDYIRQNIPGVRLIEVWLQTAPWDSPEPAVILDVYRPGPGGEGDQTEWTFGQWQVRTFPPEVWSNFTMLMIDE